MDGRDDGWTEGDDDGSELGLSDGSILGSEEGVWLGESDGSEDGSELGLLEGIFEGIPDGKTDGAFVGKEEGIADGDFVGYDDGKTLCSNDNRSSGSKFEGKFDGDNDGNLGDLYPLEAFDETFDDLFPFEEAFDDLFPLDFFDDLDEDDLFFFNLLVGSISSDWTIDRWENTNRARNNVLACILFARRRCFCSQSNLL